MKNLLVETIESLEQSGHTIEDIIFIGSVISGYYCDWEEFKKLANREYDNGYGAPEVALDLEIIFSDGMRMSRHEYDGAEWWEFSKPVPELERSKKIKALFANNIGWESLEEIHLTLDEES